MAKSTTAAKKTTTTKSTAKKTAVRKTTAKKTTTTKTTAAKKTTAPAIEKEAASKSPIVVPTSKVEKPNFSVKGKVETVNAPEAKDNKSSVDSTTRLETEKVSQLGAKPTDETKPEGAELVFDMPKPPSNESITVSAENINEVINSMPEVGSMAMGQAIPATATPIEHEEKARVNAPIKSLTHITKQAISHGETILSIINGDWRMPNWGGVPVSVVHEAVSKGSKEYQYEVKETDKGMYFLLIVGEDTHRFPQDEKEFIKTV